MDKQVIRKLMLNRLKNQKEVSRLKKSEKIKRQLFRLIEFKRAKRVMFYASFAGEVDTYKMLEDAINKGKTVCLPSIVRNKKTMTARAIRSLNHSLEKGPFNIPQPRKNCSRTVAKKDLDFAVVPGLAFDYEGNRLGRGQGYYDRFLKNLSKKTYTAGVCFDFQIVTCLPHFPTDLAVKKVISA